MAGKLILTRKGSMLNRNQTFKVLIDGVEAGAIKNDDTQEFSLPEGIHMVQCKVNWTSSPIENFEVSEGANTYLSVGSGMKFIAPLYFMLLAGIFILLFYDISKIPMPASINVIKLVLVLPALIYIGIYMTVLRKKYLLIGVDKTNPFS